MYIILQNKTNFTKFTLFVAEEHVGNRNGNINLWKSSGILINLILYFKSSYLISLKMFFLFTK